MTTENIDENEKIITELIDEDIVALVAKEVIKKMELEFSEEEGKHFTQILVALIKSVPVDTLRTLICEDEKEIKKKVKKAKEEFDKNTMDNEFISPDHKKRLISQYRYFETDFKNRNLIQNYNWEYPEVFEQKKEKGEEIYEPYDSHTRDMIIAREDVFHDIYDYNENKWEGKECSYCGHTKAELRKGKILCRSCYYSGKTHRFAGICCLFRIMGDMTEFSDNLPKEAEPFICKNKCLIDLIKNRKHSPFNCIKLYSKLRKVIKGNEIEIENRKAKDKAKEEQRFLELKRLRSKDKAENEDHTCLKKSK